MANELNPHLEADTLVLEANRAHILYFLLQNEEFMDQKQTKKKEKSVVAVKPVFGDTQSLVLWS